MPDPAPDLKQFIEELKTRLPVSEVVGRSVQLKKNGREWIGLSPFSDEKTPSFTVNDQKQFWHCFSSGQSGDIISFLQQVEKLEFMEALRRLADQAGMELPRLGDGTAQKRMEPLLAANEVAASWYRRQLQEAAGSGARDYLKARAMDKETAQTYRLGYAPAGGQGLITALKEQGISEEVMIEAGLVIRPEDGGRIYERFRDRLIFPIMDVRGRVIAFGGRDLSGRARAKYLNSPETPLFHKGRTLYGLSQARKAALEEGRLFLVEGYMDVLALAGAGIAPVIAGLGTALSENHLQIMWRLAPEPIICLDGDRAGRQAALRLIDRALPELQPGHALRFMHLPAGKDPDDVIQEGGAALFEEQAAVAMPLAETIYAAHMENALWDTPERKAACLAHFNQMAGRIQNNEIRHYYRQMFKTRLDRQFWLADRRAGAVTSRQSVAPPPPADGAKRMEQILLGTLLAWPHLISAEQEKLQQLYFADPAHAELCNALISLALETEAEIDAQQFYKQAPPALQRLIEIVYGRDSESGFLDGHVYSRILPDAPRIHEAGLEARYLEHFCSQQELAALKRDMDEAYKEYSKALDEASGERFFSLQREAEAMQERLEEADEVLADELQKKSAA